jgi:short-subunit dehydrogenase
VLVARSEERLQAVADRLERRHGIRVDVIPQDLTTEEAPGRIAAEVRERGLNVDMLVNNAGFATFGRFEDIDSARDRQQLSLNILALVSLTHEMVPGMLAKGSGTIINVASLVAFQPMPYFATYAASKAFVLNYSAALSSEYLHRGIRVLALCPGSVETPFWDSADTHGTGGAVGSMSTPQHVVRSALNALDGKRATVVPGLSNRMSAHLMPRLPRRLATAMARSFTERLLAAAAPSKQPLSSRKGI